MPAIAKHKTETSDASWDGPANEARVRSGEGVEYYRRIYAWQDPDADPTTKSAWRFIHHEVDSSGDPGAANIIACRTGIAVLNGARGGTTIPRADYQGVWAHLASHLEDAGLEAPELRMLRKFEIKTAKMRIEEDVASDGEFTGYASIFGVRDAYGDIIAKGAFKKTLESASVRPLLWGHNPLEPIGVGELSEDSRGLRMHGKLAMDVARAREALALIRAGAVRGLSIGFFVRAADEQKSGRIIREVELVEVSLTPFPANPQAQIEAAMAAALDSTTLFASSISEPDDSSALALAAQQYLRLLAARLEDSRVNKWNNLMKSLLKLSSN